MGTATYLKDNVVRIERSHRANSSRYRRIRTQSTARWNSWQLIRYCIVRSMAVTIKEQLMGARLNSWLALIVYVAEDHTINNQNDHRTIQLFVVCGKKI